MGLRCRPRARTEHDWQLAESAGDGIAVEHGLGVGRNRVVRQPGQHLLDADAELQPRQVGSEAAVHARPEAEVPVGLAIEDAAIGIRELGAVAVRG